MSPDPEEEGFVVVNPRPIFKKVWMQKPHECGGFGDLIAPYHVKCRGCKEEVRMWEFGIDYDVG